LVYREFGISPDSYVLILSKNLPGRYTGHPVERRVEHRYVHTLINIIRISIIYINNSSLLFTTNCLHVVLKCNNLYEFLGVDSRE